MECVSVYGERANGNVIFFECVDEGVVLFVVCQESGGIALCFAGVTACAELNGMNTEGGEGLQGLLQRLVVIKISQYA